MVTFITSVRHPLNSNSYSDVLQLLETSLKSVCNQVDPDFTVVVVCNEKPELLFNDSRIEYVCVDFPPPSQSEGPRTGKEAARLDKGSKYVIGLLAAKKINPEYVMFFDADDYVHKNISKFCNNNIDKNGWYVANGFVHSEGSMIYSSCSDFYKWCGTCNIVNYQLLPLPENLTMKSSLKEICRSLDKYFLYKILGAHPFTVDYFQKLGTPLEPLPFAGAVYVRGTGENHSGIFINGMPRIIDGEFSDVYGMGIKATVGRWVMVFCFELPLALYRVVKYRRKLVPPT